MAYMAPEILAKRGYTYTIDWWSLGVCAFELVFGRRPFRGRTNSDLTHSISRDHLKFPDDTDTKCSREGVYALKQFLDRDCHRRLGCKPNGEGLADVKRHPWFKGFDWRNLKDQVPPFVPDPKKANFDATHELEELLLEDNPLKARKRNPNQDINDLSAEMRQMEEQFTRYDFKAMHRRSYYPHNQQMVSTVTAPPSLNLSRAPTPAHDADSISNRSPDELIPPVPSRRASAERF